MDWEKLARFYLSRLSSKISPFSKPFLAFPSPLMPAVDNSNIPKTEHTQILLRYIIFLSKC